VGDEGDFDEFKAVFMDELPGESNKTTYVEWTPKIGVNPHTCARVILRRLFNDTNEGNNRAQKNLEVDHSKHGSPYTTVEFPFQVKNDRPTRRPIYFQIHGIPDGWTWSVNPPKLALNPGERGNATLKMTPPDDAPDCTTHKVQVTGWTPDGDTLVQLGGAQVNVQLTENTELTGTVTLEKCKAEDLKKKSAHGNSECGHS
jgi:hypothetical protein